MNWNFKWLTHLRWVSHKSIQMYACMSVSVHLSNLTHFWVWATLIKGFSQLVCVVNVTKLETNSTSFKLPYDLSIGRTEAICWIILKTLYAQMDSRESWLSTERDKTNILWQDREWDFMKIYKWTSLRPRLFDYQMLKETGTRLRVTCVYSWDWNKNVTRPKLNF